MARFGRGRARRQERRAGRQGRRALGQMDRAMRGAYGDIAFPAGASPMMAGMPMMGTQGAMSPRMHFEGERGLFGRLKNFKMDIDGMGMPMNFSRGMFMNGIFNPYGQQGGYNDTAYKIRYPGKTNFVEATKKEADAAVDNEEIADEVKTPSTEGNCEPCEDGRTPGKDIEGNCEPCAEKPDSEKGGDEDGNNVNKECPDRNSSVNEAGQCQCNEGFVLDDNANTFKCISIEEKKSKLIKGAPEKDWKYYGAIGGVSLAGVIGAGWLGKKAYNGIKSALAKKPNASQSVKKALIKEIVKQFPSEFVVANRGTLQLPSGAGKQIVQKEILGEVFDQSATAATTKVAPVIKPKLALPPGPNRLNIGQGARKISNAERAFLMQEIEGVTSMSKKAAMKLAKAYGVKVPKGSNLKQIKIALFNVARKLKTGGAVDAMDKSYGDPDLYRFTGGGDPGFVDYFADGGYYEDGDPPLQPTTASYLDKQFPGTGLRKELEKVPNMGRAAGSLSGVNQFLTNSDYKNSRVDDVAVYDFLPFAGGRPESVEAGNRAMIENQIRESGEDIEGHPYYNQSDVDYFDEDYDTGMAYGGSAQPQYKNVYDPYMPMAGNGMTMVNRPYQTAAEYGNEYAPYPGPYAEPMVTDSIRNSVIDSRRLIDGITDEEIERSTVRQQYGGYQEGDEVYMTGGELAQYLAGGGQVEFID